LTVQTEPIDRANKNIRSVTRLLNNEAFLKENGMLVMEIIELFDDFEGQSGNISTWKVYNLNYRCILITNC
jgi:hypothetical protein